MKKQGIFAYLSVLLILLATQLTIADHHEEKTVSEKLKIPISVQPQTAFFLYPKTLDEIIESKTNITISEVVKEYNISAPLEKVLTNTTVMQLLSCFPSLDLTKTMDHNIRTLIELFPPSVSFIETKIATLKSRGLESIITNSSIDIGSPKLNGLEFCRQLEDVVSKNYQDVILRKEANSLNQSIEQFVGSFKTVGISNTSLSSFIQALYSNNIFGVSTMQKTFQTNVFIKLNSIQLGDLNETDVAKSFYNFLETKFGIFQAISKTIFVKYLGLSTKASDVMEFVKMKELSSHRTLGNIVIFVPAFGMKLDHVVSSLPIIIATAQSRIFGVQNIIAQNLDVLIINSIGVTEGFFKFWFHSEYAKIFGLINGTSTKNLMETYYNNEISTNQLMLISFKDFLDNLMNYPGRMEKLMQLSREGLHFIINKVSIGQLMSIYGIPQKDFIQPVENIIGNYIAGNDKSLVNDITFKAVTRHFFREFNFPQVAVKTGSSIQVALRGTLGSYNEIIENRYGYVVRNALLEMQFLQVLPIFCGIKRQEFLKLKIGEVTKQCADLDLDDKTKDIGVKGLSNGNLELLSKHTTESLLARFEQLGIGSYVTQKISLRQLAAIVADESSVAVFALPLMDLITETNFSAVENMTLATLLETKGKHDFQKISSDLKSAYNIAALKNESLISITKQLGIQFSMIFHQTLHHVLQIFKFLDDPNYIAFLDLDILRAMCDTISGTIQDIGNSCQFTTANPYTLITNVESILNYTVTEIEQVAMIGETPNTRKSISTRDMFSYVVEGFAGLRRIQHMVRVPLIILTKQHNVSLQQLTSQSLTQTIMNMFQINYDVVKKVFNGVPNNILNIVQRTPFSQIPSQEDGLDNVQQLYTGSIETIAEAIVSGNSGAFAVKQHLPRYVKLIAKMNFMELFKLYEVSEEDLLNATKFKDLLAVGLSFFGIHTDSLFQASFDVSLTELNRIKEKSIADIFNLYKYKMQQPEKEIIFGKLSLTDLVKFIADPKLSYSDSILYFLLTPLGDLATKIKGATPSNIQQILENGKFGVNLTEAFDLLKKLSGDNFSNGSAVATYVLFTDLAKVGINLKKTELELKKLNVYNLMKETSLTHINECETNTHLCNENAKCTYVPGGHICECMERFSGNGSVCDDACSTNVCPSSSVCVNVDTGALCVCNSTDHLYNKEKNICESGKAVVKLEGMKFQLEYVPQYTNKHSKKYTEMSRKVGELLTTFLQKENNDVVGVRVTDMRSGSIIVDADVIFNSEQDDAQRKKLTEYLTNADKTELEELKPVPHFRAVVFDANECTDRSNPCQNNEYCSRTSATTYKCSCMHGYQLNNGKCVEEKESSSSDVVKIIVPIVVVLLLLFLVGCACYFSRNNKRSKTKSSNDGFGNAAIENPTYDTKE